MTPTLADCYLVPQACVPVPRDLTAVSAKQTADTAAEQRLAPYPQYLAAIRTVLSEDGIIVDEVSQAGFSSQVAYPVLRPRTYIIAGFQGTLGFGFPTSVGVKVANPQTPVISVTGDGGFMFGVQELAIIAQENIGVIVVIFNNSAFSNVKRDQQRLYEGRLMARIFAIRISLPWRACATSPRASSHHPRN